MKGHALAVIGGQYGSEGKGRIHQELAASYSVHVRISTGESSHTVIGPENTPVQLRYLPSAAFHRNAQLLIGAGSIISRSGIGNLLREIRTLHEYDPNFVNRLSIDSRIPVTVDRTILEMRQSLLDPTSIVTRLRDLVQDLPELAPYLTDNTPLQIWHHIQGGKNVVLEGRGGSAQSPLHGEWPHVLNHDSNAAQLAADVGISPRFVKRVLLVVRTLPIRPRRDGGVLRKELSWDSLAERGAKIDPLLVPTHTIGEWDDALVAQSAMLNAPTSIAVTFLDYLSPTDSGRTDMNALSDHSQRFLQYVQSRFSAPVAFVSTGGTQLATIQTSTRV